MVLDGERRSVHPPTEKFIFGKCCMWPWPLDTYLENVTIVTCTYV